MDYARHDLLTFTEAGRDFARSHAAAPAGVSAGAVARLIRCGPGAPPAIVRRQQGDSGWDVGFTSHHTHNGTRLRVASTLPANTITARLTPYEVAALRHRCAGPLRQALNALADAAAANGFSLGVFGSAAMQIFTGLPYWGAASDIDLLLCPAGSKGEAGAFFEAMRAAEERYGVSCDAELALKGGYAVKWKELRGQSATLLLKGLRDVRLTTRAEVETMLHDA